MGFRSGGRAGFIGSSYTSRNRLGEDGEATRAADEPVEADLDRGCCRRRETLYQTSMCGMSEYHRVIRSWTHDDRHDQFRLLGSLLMLPTKAIREKTQMQAPTRLLSRSRRWGRILTQNRLETSLEKTQTRRRLQGPTCSLFMCVLYVTSMSVWLTLN